MDKFVVRLTKTVTNETSQTLSSPTSSNPLLSMPTLSKDNSIFNVSESSSNSGIEDSEVVAKKSKRTRAFRNQWINDFPWLECRNEFAFCKVCDTRLTNIKSHLVRHNGNMTHKKNFEISKITPINELFENSTKGVFERQTKESELILVMFCVMHHLPFTLMDFLPNLLKKCCPDSKIAQNIRCSRTKASEIVKNVLGEKGRQHVANQVRNQKFSVIIDETTDVSAVKSLAMVARVFDRKRCYTRDRFLGLLNLVKTDAASIVSTIVSHLNMLQIPVNNIIGLGSDNAAVMSGQFTGVQARLKEIIPNLFFFNCICHSLHLCASNACQQLPFSVEQLARNIFNFFAHSSKRINNLKEFQEVFSIKPHKILGFAQTRWLSLELVVNRILEQWNALQLNFISCTLEDKGSQKTARSLAEQLGNSSNKIYFLFLSYILKIINKMNLEFQSEEIRIHTMYDTMETNFKIIMSNFVDPKCLLNITNVNNIDFINEANHLPLTEISMGCAVQTFLNQNELEETELLQLTSTVKKFYIELAQQIKSRFDFNNQVFKLLSLISPENLLSSNVSAITPLLNYFPNLISSELEKDIILDELKVLKFSAYLTNLDKSDVGQFWSKIGSIKNSLGEHIFENLSNFMINLMCLPHSSAAAERIFSDLSNTKTRNTNRLLIETIDSMMAAKELLTEEQKKSISSNRTSDVWVPQPDI